MAAIIWREVTTASICCCASRTRGSSVCGGGCPAVVQSAQCAGNVGDFEGGLIVSKEADVASFLFIFLPGSGGPLPRVVVLPVRNSCVSLLSCMYYKQHLRCGLVPSAPKGQAGVRRVCAVRAVVRNWIAGRLLPPGCDPKIHELHCQKYNQKLRLHVLTVKIPACRRRQYSHVAPTRSRWCHRCT